MGDLVYARGAPPMPGGAIDYPKPLAFILYSGVDPLNLGSHEGLAYLLRIVPFDSAVTLDVPMPLPGGDLDYRHPLFFTVQGNMRTIYPAATISRSSKPSDSPSNLWVPGKFGGSIKYTVALFDGANPLLQSAGTVGVLQIEDPDGELDHLVSLGWDAAPLSLLRGDPKALFSSWKTVAKLTTAGVLYDADKKEIKLRDLGWQLAQAELHGNRYLGTGGIEGDAKLAGVLKPYAIGRPSNISPTLINAALLILQASFTSLRDVIEVRDGGAALEQGLDHPDWDSLAAATVAGGTFVTCLALGLIRLGSTPVFGITMDVEGDDNIVNGHGYPSTRAQIARRIATGYGIIRLNDTTEIDSSAYQFLEQYQPAPLGYFWNAEITKADALTEVMAGCLGWWLVRLNGQLAFGQLSDPATAAPLFTLAYPSDDPGEVRVGPPAMIDYQPPWRATLMGWARNYTVQDTNALAASLTAEQQAVYGAVTRYTTSSDLWVGNSFPSSPTMQINGGFVFEGDAQVEGDRIQRLMRKRRECFQVPVVTDPFGDFMARVLRLVNANRLGIGSARNFFCTGATVNGDGTIVLNLWG